MDENYQNETTGNMVENQVEEVKNHNMEISGTTLGHMASAGKWGVFYAVMMYIAAAFMLFAGIFYSFLCQTIGAVMEIPTVTAIFLGSFYIVIDIIYLFPATFLLKAYRAILNVGENPDNEEFATAMLNNKRFWKFTGICTIVALALAIIAIIAAIIFAAAALPSAIDAMETLAY